jgi:hypothetical protein
LKYHPVEFGPLTTTPESGCGTLSGGQFDWGGRLPKCNGGARWYPQPDWKPGVECNGIRVPDCEADGPSRVERRS